MHVSKSPVFVAVALVLAGMVLHSTRTMCNMHNYFNSVLTLLALASTTCHIGAMQNSYPPLLSERVDHSPALGDFLLSQE